MRGDARASNQRVLWLDRIDLQLRHRRSLTVTATIGGKTFSGRVKLKRKKKH